MGRSRWIALLVAVLIVLAVVLAITMNQKPYGYAPTGDVLFDRFALLVLDQMLVAPLDGLAPGYVMPRQTQTGVRLDYAEIADWESDTGHDPRYWQLRWLCGLSFYPSVGAASSTNGAAIQQIEQGVADEGSFAAIEYGALYKDNPDRAFALVEQALALSPKNAHYHYVQAYLLQQQGDAEGAMEALRRGNRTPNNDPPHLYPLNLLSGHGEYFTVEANQAVGGVLNGLALAPQSHFRWIQYKRLVKDVLAAYERRLPPEVADELLTCAARYGDRSDLNVMRALMSLILMGIVLDRVQEDGTASSLEQRQDLQKMVELKDLLLEKLEHYVESKPLEDEGRPTYQSFVDWWAETPEEGAFLESECLPILAEIGSIKLAE